VPGRNAPGDELIDLIGVRQKQINQVFIDGARVRDSTVECGDTLRSSEAPQKNSHARIFEASFFRRCRFFPIDSLDRDAPAVKRESERSSEVRAIVSPLRSECKHASGAD
jgi:hypothetical protein